MNRKDLRFLALKVNNIPQLNRIEWYYDGQVSLLFIVFYWVFKEVNVFMFECINNLNLCCVYIMFWMCVVYILCFKCSFCLSRVYIAFYVYNVLFYIRVVLCIYWICICFVFYICNMFNVCIIFHACVVSYVHIVFYVCIMLYVCIMFYVWIVICIFARILFFYCIMSLINLFYSNAIGRYMLMHVVVNYCLKFNKYTYLKADRSRHWLSLNALGFVHSAAISKYKKRCSA